MQRTITFSPRTVLRWQLAIIAGLLLLHVAVSIAYGLGHQHLGGVRKLFDVSEERNVPTYFSALALLACGLTALLNLALDPAPRAARAWLLMAAGFIYLSFDESCAIHELLNRVGGGLGLSGPLLYFWVIPYGALALVAAAVFLPFLRDLPAATRNGLVLGGCVYVAGALGMELAEGAIVTHFGQQVFQHGWMRLFLGIEEGGEMIGVAILLRTLLGNLVGRGAIALTAVQAQAKRAPSAAQTAQRS